MESKMKKLTCRVLVVSTLVLSFQTANAGLIGADRAAAPTAPAERALVLAALDRSDVSSRLEAMGIDPQATRERVAALSDQEVRSLAQDMQLAPAGAGPSTGGWLAIIAVLAIVWYVWMRK